MEGILPECKFQ